jgi:peptidoglycan/LPS O-acetylase OafA/YrhL
MKAPLALLVAATVVCLSASPSAAVGSYTGAGTLLYRGADGLVCQVVVGVTVTDATLRGTLEYAAAGCLVRAGAIVVSGSPATGYSGSLPCDASTGPIGPSTYVSIHCPQTVTVEYWISGNLSFIL